MYFKRTESLKTGYGILFIYQVEINTTAFHFVILACKLSPTFLCFPIRAWLNYSPQLTIDEGLRDDADFRASITVLEEDAEVELKLHLGL